MDETGDQKCGQCGNSVNQGFQVCGSCGAKFERSYKAAAVLCVPAFAGFKAAIGAGTNGDLTEAVIALIVGGLSVVGIHYCLKRSWVI